MQRRIADIKKDISAHSARSAWDKGVKGYAVELFDDYLDRLHITDDSVRIGKVAEADLLNGAQNWEQYSYGKQHGLSCAMRTGGIEMSVAYQPLTHPRVAEFARKFRFPGWYIDSTGCYGCLLGKYWIAVFVNDCDESLDITVDTVGETGYFDKNLEWETAESDDELALTATRFVAKYAMKS